MKLMRKTSLVLGLTILLAATMAAAETTNPVPASARKVVKQILSGGGVKGHSATFTEVGTFGETFVGVRLSPTYTVSQGFWNAEAVPSCCVGLVGNIDCDPNDQIDIVDLTRLIDYLFISFKPLCCDAEANFGQNASAPGATANRPDIASLTAIIDYMFVNFTPLPSCP